MQARTNTLNWDFPDLDKHHPDCSAVTNKLLHDITASRWPIKNGVVKIPYTFTTNPCNDMGYMFVLFKYLIFKFAPLQESNELVRETVRAALKNWEKISGGMIQFYENPNAHYWSPGVFFSLLPQATLDARGASAMTLMMNDNNGEMKKAFVYYPDTPTFWDPPANSSAKGLADTVNTYHHEIGHALGIDDIFRYPEVEARLSQTTDGVFCSVMPYMSHITTNTSQCVDNCNPPYAVFPTTLEEEWFKAVYKDKLPTCRKANSMTTSSYAINAMDAMCVGAATTFSHQFAVSFLKKFAVNPDQPVLSENTAYFIADTGMLVALICLDMPVWPTCVYAVTAATKYLPDDLLNKLPQLMKTVITSNSSVFILNLSLTTLQGHCPVPLIISTITSLIGSAVGTLFGKGLGAGFAGAANKITPAIYAKCVSTPPSALPDGEETPLHRAADSPAYGTMSAASNRNGFFHKVQHWFKHSDHQEIIDIENPLPAPH